MSTTQKSFLQTLGLVLICGLLTGPAVLAELEPSPNTVIVPAPPELCALLDDPDARAAMDGLFFNLVWSCGRQADFLDLGGESGYAAPVTQKHPISTQADAPVNDRTGETHPSATQSETTMAEDRTNGILCSAFNDSWEFYSGGGGFNGFSRSTDGGASWEDRGAVGATAFGDPSLVWRQRDGDFYLATLDSGGGLALWVSRDDCQSFVLRRRVSVGSGDDKVFLAVDNYPSSPFYGDLYIAWTRLGASTTQILVSRSSDAGGTWTTPVGLQGAISPDLVQGPWPAVAPNGDLYVAFMHVINFPGGNITAQIFSSSDAAVTFVPRTAPLSGAVTPRNLTATANCQILALNGDIRILPSPQLAIDDQGRLHVVYSRDPDTVGSGDDIDIYYRRSTDGAASWGPEIRLSDDTTLNDQYHPTILADGDTVMATWYDRRRDPANVNIGYFKRVSTNGGLTWFNSVRVSNGTFGIVQDPGTARCYHGDYDQGAITTLRSQVVQWSDDRAGDPDVFAEASHCFGGSASGSWRLPTSGPQPFGGTLTGGQAGDPVLYTVNGQAFPNGSLSGTMTGAAPNTTAITFTGNWAASTSFTSGANQGTFTVQLFPAFVPGFPIGTMTGGWSVPGTPSFNGGSYRALWNVCLR